MASGTTVLLLKEGGTLEGKLLNPDEISRKSYRIKTSEGLEVNLDAKLIDREQSRERQAVIEYNVTAPFTENTIENHLYWATWCHERQLPNQARLHWQQILEIDSDHADARRILGYVKTTDGWVSQQDNRERRGFVQDRGRWKTSQQIEVENILETQKNAELQWRRTIRDLCRRLPNVQAETALLEIRDPAACIPLRDALVDEGNPYVRMVLLRSLIRIPHISAVRLAAGWSIRPDEPSDEIRQMCIDELLRMSKENPEIRRMMIDVYRSSLRTGIDPIIRLAAKVLSDIGGYEAVPELIDTLVVTTMETFQDQPSTYSIGSSGTSLVQGAKPTKRQVQVSRPVVLTALHKLTGVNFQFDQAMWREWYRQSQRSPSFNLRRD